jgi:hypothetical protein
MFRLNRPTEGLMLLRGGHELAVANDLESVHRRSRTILTFYEQFADPVAGLELAREGFEYAKRTGSSAYAFLMVGNAVSCALRVGDWTWAREIVDEWLNKEITGQFYLEVFADRAVLRALVGEDAGADITAAEQLLPGVDDPQYASYVDWAKAWQALAAGDLAAAQRHFAVSAQRISYFMPISMPMAVRTTLWQSDRTGAAGLMADLETLRAGFAAVDGRRAEAIAGYREALRGWKQLGCAFDEALAALDMATLLKPTEREMPEAASLIEDARQALLKLDAKPLVARLESATADRRSSAPSSEPQASSVPVTA